MAVCRRAACFRHRTSSAASTCSTASRSSLITQEDDRLETWMYWRRESTCWMKVLVVLRQEFLWLTRGDSASATMPLIQIAVKTATETSIGGVVVSDLSGETLELYMYDRDETGVWMAALREAASITESQLEMLASQQHATKNTRFLFCRSSKAYHGTLQHYRKSQAHETTLKRVLSLHKLRTHCKSRLEKLLDAWNNDNQQRRRRTIPRRIERS